MTKADAGRLAKWANSAYQRGNYADAAVLASKAYSKYSGHPDSTKILLLSGKASFASGETVFIFTRVSDLNDRILRQTSDSVVNTYKAKKPVEKALSVLQSITVYHCLVATGDQPHNDLLTNYVTRSGGATFIPVVFVPDINQVIYPDVEEKVGSVRPRIEYLQYLLGERRESVNMHRQTVQAFYISIAVLAVLLLAIAFSFIH